MIGVAQLLYDIELKLNKVATNAHQNIPLEDKIIALNQAQIKLIKDKLYSIQGAGSGLDAFKRRYDDLENLVQPHLRLPVVKDNSTSLHKYLVDLGSITPGCMFYIDSYFVCDKSPCKNIPVVTHRIKHADLQAVMANTNTCPSFEYQEAPVTVSDQMLEFYTDGSFAPTDAYVSYLRYPVKIDAEGYLDFNGAPSVTTDCELKAYLQDELTDLAIQQLAFNTENQPAAQAAGIRIQSNP